MSANLNADDDFKRVKLECELEILTLARNIDLFEKSNFSVTELLNRRNHLVAKLNDLLTSAPQNQYEFIEPSQDEKFIIYRLYELIYRSNFSLVKKSAMMTAALDNEKWSRRVVGISEDAIKAIAGNGFKKPNGKLTRAHSISPSETYFQLFYGALLPFQPWWDWVWERDKTTMMTLQEYHSQRISKVYLLDPMLSYFVATESSGWHHSKSREGELIKRMCEEHSIFF